MNPTCDHRLARSSQPGRPCTPPRIPGHCPAFCRLAALTLACALVALWLPSTAHSAANPVVYHSPNDDGLRTAETPEITASPSFVLHLYMDEDDGTATASSSNPCSSSGDGDERCGWDLRVAASGDVDFVSFSESGDVVAGLTSGASPVLLFNGGVPNTGELGVVKLGDLEISSTGIGTVFLSGGTVVTASQDKVGLAAADLIAVPEPSAALSLLAGATLLGGLQTHRRTRARA